MALLNLDVTDVAPSASRGLLPVGRYIAQITGSDLKDNNASTGQYLELEFTIMEGPHAGRKVWERLNIKNQSEKAEQIARQDLSAIGHAVGVTRIADSVDLHGKPLAIDVGIEKPREVGQEPRSRIRGYMSAELAAHAMTPSAAKPAFGAAANTGAPAGKASTPWGKRA